MHLKNDRILFKITNDYIKLVLKTELFIPNYCLYTRFRFIGILRLRVIWSQ